jgi:electron transfer flavoprotein alpha subunit
VRSITCIKYVPKNLENNFNGKEIIREGMSGCLNPADMFAIEEAIRIKEKTASEAIGLCMGVASAEQSLRNAIAMGLDEVYLATDKLFAGSDTYATSYILSKCIEYIGNYDLIILGKQSIDGDTGQVAPELASHFNIPCIMNVVSLEFNGNHQVRCKVLTEQGYSLFEAQLPIAISVLKGINEPRIPSVAGLLSSQSKKIKLLNTEMLQVDILKCGLNGSPTKVTSIRENIFEKRNSIDITSNYLSIFDDLINKIINTKSVSTRPANESKRPETNSTIHCKEIWVVAEAVDGVVTETTLQLLTKASVLAEKIDATVSAVYFGEDNTHLQSTLTLYGADNIYVAFNIKNDCLFDERTVQVLVSAYKEYRPEIILYPSTVWGRWLAPTVAVQLSTGLTADCSDLRIDTKTGCMIQTRIAFSGNLIADIVCPNNRPQMATVRPNVFVKNTRSDISNMRIIDISRFAECNNRISLIKKNIDNTSAAKLYKSDIIIAGGRGMCGKENFLLLFKLADLLGGAVAATRVVVDANWADYSHQVGQTGIYVRPKLYIAFGISGASEHIIGMRDSVCIVAINTNPAVPIIGISDYYIVDDCIGVIKSLISRFEIKRSGGMS